LSYTEQSIEAILSKFQPVIGKDIQLYKNHVYRVYLNCLIIDPDSENRIKYAIASAFHDIGIWTDHTFDYLAPSIKQAELYLVEINKQEWIEEISSMIYWHHKISRYKGEYNTTVENFRKADWIDVSSGIITYGFDKAKIKETRRAIPTLGFHRFLLKQTLRHFIKKPLRPLPMFKK
jgi:hypothetical protein